MVSVRSLCRFVFTAFIYLLYACGGGGGGSSSSGSDGGSSGGQSVADTLPNSPDIAFHQSTVAPSETVSESFVLSGVNRSVSISVEGADYSVDGGEFTSESTMVSNGQTVTIRMSAPSGFGETQIALVTIGELEMELQIGSEAEDLMPDLVELDSPVVAKGQLVEFVVPVSGINSIANISLETGAYAIDGGDFTSEAGTVENGQTVVIRVVASNTFLETVSGYLTIGDGVTPFSVITEAEDLTPDTVLSETPVVAKGQVVEHAFVVSGINSTAAISIDVGEYSVDGGAFSGESSVVQNGSQVRVRQVASQEFSQTITSNLSIGTANFRFRITTEAEDLEPDSYSFDAVGGVEPESVVVSLARVLQGVNNSVVISIVGGEFSIDGGEFTSESGTIESGQSFQVRTTASSQAETQTTATLTISGVTADFVTVTRSENNLPAGKIMFPIKDAFAETGNYLLSGIASDESGFESLTINGQSVEIVSEVVVDGLVNVEWQLPVRFSESSQSFILAGVDTKGNVNQSMDEVTVSVEQLPPAKLGLDEVNNRLVGLTDWSSLVSYDYINQQYREHANLDYEWLGADASCYYQSGEAVIFADLVDTYGDLVFKSRALDENYSSSLGAVFLDPVAEGFNPGLYIGEMVCDQANDVAYLLVNFHGEDYYHRKSIILSVALQEPFAVTTFIETGSSTSSDWFVDNLGISGSILLAADSNADTGFYAIDTSDASMQLYNGDLEGLKTTFTADFSSNEIYYVANGGISVVDTQSGASSVLSVADSMEEFYLGQSRSIVRNSAGNFYVYDSDLKSIIVVDGVLGEHTELNIQSLGSGPKIVAARNLAVSSDTGTVYVLADGSNGPEQLIAVDLLSGERDLVGNINNAGNVEVDGIALDESNNIAYVVVGEEIKAVDLSSEQVTTVASRSVGTGVSLENIVDILFDQSNGRLLVADYELKAVIAVNLESLDRTFVSYSDSIGTGPVFDGLIGIDATNNPNIILATDSLSNRVYSVSLETGNRNLLFDGCSVGGSDLFPEQVVGAAYNSLTNEVYVHGYSLIRYDMNDSSCEHFSSVSVQDLVITDDGLIFAVDNNKGLIQINSENSDSVTITQ